MENGPPAPGLEEGTIDVESLLGEPQDGHESMDSVICFNEKIQANVMGMEDVPHSFGCKDAAIPQERKDILNGEVLEVMPSGVEAGFFRLHNDFCSMGEDYLLGSGVDFDESITNMGYGSSESLQASVLHSQMQVPNAGSNDTWKSDLFRITEVPDCTSDQFNIRSSEVNGIPSSHECQMMVEVKPSISHRCTLQNIGNFRDNSSCSLQDTLSDENDGSLSPSRQMFGNLNTQGSNEFELAGRVGKTCTFNAHEDEARLSVKGGGDDAFPTQKRSRKPTQRYIDELSDPVSTFSRKRRSSSSAKDKSCGVKDKKKCSMGSKEPRVPDEEEFSVKAIQVPFGSLVHKECPEEHGCDMVQPVDNRKLITMSKCKRVTPENKHDFFTEAHPKVKNNNFTANLKKRDACITAPYKKKKNGRISSAGQKKRINSIIDDGPKKSDGNAAAASLKRKEELYTAKQQKKEDCLSSESLDEGSGRRKHHRLWTITEIKKLIDGVSQYGVGRWSRIKKLFFSSSAHRTSVDLKDKWRNLLKTSGIQEQGNHQGDKKRSVAWRPLPKSILRRVCELATLYPYPKGQRPKIGVVHNNIVRQDSPERSADIVLSDYRRILRSINSN